MLLRDPDLKIGMINEDFYRSGKHPEFKDSLK